MQPASTRFGHFHDCCRRSCFANSPSGWEAIQDDRRGGFCEKHPFPAVVLYCPHLWSHSFAPDLPSPHVWLLPGGEISLDTPLSYPVVAWPSNLLSQRWSSGAQTPFLPYGWNGGREAQPPKTLFLIRSPENFLATLQCLSSCFILSDGHYFQASCQDFVMISEPDGRQSRRRP